MDIKIEKFTEDKIEDIVAFEKDLRCQEADTYFWNIDEKYIENVRKSFQDKRFESAAVSLLAYRGNDVIGRIDASLICSRFDGTIGSAYLDWICVLKNERHNGIAQKLIEALEKDLKECGVGTLIAIMAGNGEAVKFYRSLENAEIHDEAVWINL